MKITEKLEWLLNGEVINSFKGRNLASKKHTLDENSEEFLKRMFDSIVEGFRKKKEEECIKVFGAMGVGCVNVEKTSEYESAITVKSIYSNVPYSRWTYKLED